MKTQSVPLSMAAICLVFSIGAGADTHGSTVSTALQATPKSSCLAHGRAEAEAERLALKSAQTYCRSEGFGWRAASIKNIGNIDCRRCGGEQISCGYEQVSLECRKAESKLSWAGWFGDRF